MARGPASQDRALSTFSADLIDLKPGDFVVHAEHGVGQYPGPARDRPGRSQGRLHAARIRRRRQALRAADAHGPGAALPRRRRSPSPPSTAWAAPPGPAPRRASKPKCATWRTSCSSSTPSARWPKASSFSPDSNWQREFEDAFEFTETKDQLTAIKEIKRDMESPAAHGPPAVRRRRLRQDRSGHARRLQGAGRRQAGGRARAYHRARLSALRDLQAPLPAVPGARRNVQPLPLAEGNQGSAGGPGAKARSISPSARTACSRRTSSSAISAW